MGVKHLAAGGGLGWLRMDNEVIHGAYQRASEYMSQLESIRAGDAEPASSLAGIIMELEPAIAAAERYHGVKDIDDAYPGIKAKIAAVDALKSSLEVAVRREEGLLTERWDRYAAAMRRAESRIQVAAVRALRDELDETARGYRALIDAIGRKDTFSSWRHSRNSSLLRYAEWCSEITDINTKWVRLQADIEGGQYQAAKMAVWLTELDILRRQYRGVVQKYTSFAHGSPRDRVFGYAERFVEIARMEERVKGRCVEQPSRVVHEQARITAPALAIPECLVKKPPVTLRHVKAIASLDFAEDAQNAPGLLSGSCIPSASSIPKLYSAFAQEIDRVRAELAAQVNDVKSMYCMEGGNGGIKGNDAGDVKDSKVHTDALERLNDIITMYGLLGDIPSAACGLRSRVRRLQSYHARLDADRQKENLAEASDEIMQIGARASDNPCGTLLEKDIDQLFSVKTRYEQAMLGVGAGLNIKNIGELIDEIRARDEVVMAAFAQEHRGLERGSFGVRTDSLRYASIERKWRSYEDHHV